MQRRSLARCGWPSKHGSPRTHALLGKHGRPRTNGSCDRLNSLERLGVQKSLGGLGDHQHWGGTVTTAILETKKDLEIIEGLLRL